MVTTGDPYPPRLGCGRLVCHCDGSCFRQAFPPTDYPYFFSTVSEVRDEPKPRKWYQHPRARKGQG